MSRLSWHLLHYLLTAIVFFLIDIVWLAFIAKDLYHESIGFLMAESTNWTAAGLFYAIFIAGIMFFVVTPALAKNKWRLALTNGVVFGLVTYATYDLTNLATLEGWPVNIVIYDLLWGAFISASTGSISFFIGKKIFNS